MKFKKKAAGVDPGYKKFRQSPAFKPVAQSIANDIRRIFAYAQRIEDGFASIDIVALINEFAQGNSDLNDQVIATLCQSRGLILVTHDADFKDRGLNLLTSNNRLLI